MSSEHIQKLGSLGEMHRLLMKMRKIRGPNILPWDSILKSADEQLSPMLVNLPLPLKNLLFQSFSMSCIPYKYNPCKGYDLFTMQRLRICIVFASPYSFFASSLQRIFFFSPGKPFLLHICVSNIISKHGHFISVFCPSDCLLENFGVLA